MVSRSFSTEKSSPVWLPTCEMHGPVTVLKLAFTGGWAAQIGGNGLMARGAGGPSLELLWDPLLIPQNASYNHSPVKREGCPKNVEFGVVWSPRQTWSRLFWPVLLFSLDFRSSQRLVRMNTFGPGSTEETHLSCSCSWAPHWEIQGLRRRQPGWASRGLLRTYALWRAIPLQLITPARQGAALTWQRLETDTTYELEQVS